MSKWVEQFNGRMDAWGRKLHEKEIRIPIDLVTGVVFFLVGLGTEDFISLTDDEIEKYSQYFRV